ncbi:hypothetical protein EPA93_40395 [Ktedonosporobacter rubrisoli]|uniref:YbjN domain-containing protein n=1 Tax=Ktedonosporobacter rubrisoli TaxID=2509675 RepID=A0A4P6K1L6_KTERU|nr:YbjN domain-containing protein [Ktedonosporobacter rubrisoli]QBD81905.1 hypothetical protein EPA93_40395 [Ktedonosporobacter rubrisoli]
MADNFGIPQLIDYLTRMGLKLANVDQEKNFIELLFQGNDGQWRMVVGIQQQEDARRLMLVAPQIGAISSKKRLECLEALMAVNYRIAIGKFGLDLDDGEIRLEEAIPLADNTITFEQFQLAFGAIVQTAMIYHSLLPRIVYNNMSVEEALQACEDEFFQQYSIEQLEPESSAPAPEAENAPELDVNDVLAEVTRMLKKHQD